MIVRTATKCVVGETSKTSRETVSRHEQSCCLCASAKQTRQQTISQLLQKSLTDSWCRLQRLAMYWLGLISSFNVTSWCSFVVFWRRWYLSHVHHINLSIQYNQSINQKLFRVAQGRILLVGRPGANIEDGSSLIIHWSSGDQRTGLINTTFIIGGAGGCQLVPRCQQFRLTLLNSLTACGLCSV